jgi:hypothetical protein
MLKKPRLRGFIWKLFGYFQMLLILLLITGPGFSFIGWVVNFVQDSLSGSYLSIISIIVFMVLGVPLQIIDRQPGGLLGGKPLRALSLTDWWGALSLEQVCKHGFRSSVH